MAAVENTVGIPVAQMDDAYSQETLKLAEVVDRYANMDVYDAERPKLVGVRPLPTNVSAFAVPCMLNAWINVN